MTVAVKRSSTAVRVALSGDLSLSDAAALHRELTAAVDADAALRVDASGVTRVDTGVVQALLFAARRARELRVDARSDAWAAAWTLLGLDGPARR